MPRVVLQISSSTDITKQRCIKEMRASSSGEDWMLSAAAFNMDHSSSSNWISIRVFTICVIGIWVGEFRLWHKYSEYFTLR